MTTVLMDNAEAKVEVTPAQHDRRLVSVRLRQEANESSYKQCETSYPLDLPLAADARTHGSETVVRGDRA